MLDNRIETHRSWCHGGTTSAPVLGDVRLTNLGPLLGLLEVLLGLPELGQVDGGDLLRFLDLLLVGLDLLLQFVHQVGDPVLVLLVLLLLEEQLLHAALTLGDGLVHLVSVLDRPAGVAQFLQIFLDHRSLSSIHYIKKS